MLKPAPRRDNCDIILRRKLQARRQPGSPSMAAFLSGCKQLRVSQSGTPDELIVVKLFRHRSADQLDAYDRRTLTEIGFNIVPAKNFDLGSACVSKKLGDNQYVMIHCCCEHGNLLSMPIVPDDKDVKFVSITEDEDFTRRETVDSVIKQIHGPGDMFSFDRLVRGDPFGSTSMLNGGPRLWRRSSIIGSS